MNLNDDMIVCGNRVIAKSYAKINLTLDVLGKLPNGYHEVKMIMQTVNLFDLVIIDKRPFGIQLTTNSKILPSNEKNIAYKAANLFFQESNINGGAKILIHKNIPIAAGLAGGSGNAAIVLCALNSLYNTNYSNEKLQEMALQLGADVPYCIIGGTCIAEGIGEKLTVLPSIPSMPIVLVKPDINISTQSIYTNIDSTPNLTHPNTDNAVKAIKTGDMELLFSNMQNIMEDVSTKICPEIISIKNTLKELGANVSLMSGSGPTVYGIFEDNATAKTACDQLSKKYKQTFFVHTFN